MSDARPLRTCTRCGQTDDHPRHNIGVAPGQTPVNFHMDCHAALGCPICIEQISDAGGVTGDELRGLLVSKAPMTPERAAELLRQPANT